MTVAILVPFNAPIKVLNATLSPGSVQANVGWGGGGLLNSLISLNWGGWLMGLMVDKRAHPCETIDGETVLSTKDSSEVLSALLVHNNIICSRCPLNRGFDDI